MVSGLALGAVGPNWQHFLKVASNWKHFAGPTFIANTLKSYYILHISMVEWKTTKYVLKSTYECMYLSTHLVCI